MLQEGLLLADIYIHLPVSKLKQRLKEFLDRSWQPELALTSDDLQEFDLQKRLELRRALSENSLKSTIHAPFFDLNPASSDKDIQNITAQRFEQTIDFATDIEADRIVFHPGYDPWRYARTPDAWLENSLEFWPNLVTRAVKTDILLCLENIFDTRPDPLVELLQNINSPNLRHCFDIGHWFLFSKTPIEDWFDRLGPFLSHLHLHDNRGRGDDHRPIGKGKIRFSEFFEQLQKIDSAPTVTLEAHNTKDAERSFKALNGFLKE